MDANKLRIKIGDHEFEAEGSAEIVQAQLAAFKELVSTATPVTRKAVSLEPSSFVDEEQQPQAQQPVANGTVLALDKIMRTEGRIVSLTARASSVDDAVMLILLGQKVFRNNDGVTGSEIIDGLRVSGAPAERVDRVLDKAATDGNIIITGAHRGKRYRFTNQGLASARNIARSVIATVP